MMKKKKKEEFLVSIITPVYNCEDFISSTIECVLKQTYKDYEYLIVDGKSKDNTLDIIKEYEPKFKGRLKWISEKDKGLYDAMNKGIKLSTGDVIGILNSDDIFASDNVLKPIIFKERSTTKERIIFISKGLETTRKDYYSNYRAK